MDTEMSMGQIQARDIKAQGHQSKQTWRPSRRLIYVDPTMLPSFSCIFQGIGLLCTKRKKRTNIDNVIKVICFIPLILISESQIQDYKIKDKGHQSK